MSKFEQSDRCARQFAFRKIVDGESFWGVGVAPDQPIDNACHDFGADLSAASHDAENHSLPPRSQQTPLRDFFFYGHGNRSLGGMANPGTFVGAGRGIITESM